MGSRYDGAVMSAGPAEELLVEAAGRELEAEFLFENAFVALGLITSLGESLRPEFLLVRMFELRKEVSRLGKFVRHCRHRLKLLLFLDRDLDLVLDALKF